MEVTTAEQRLCLMQAGFVQSMSRMDIAGLRDGVASLLRLAYPVFSGVGFCIIAPHVRQFVLGEGPWRLPVRAAL